MEDVEQGQRPFVLRLLDDVTAGAREAAGAPLLSLSTREAVELVEQIATMLDGIPHVIQPPWLDPDQKPIRNTPPQAGGAPNWQDKKQAATLGDQLALRFGASPPHAEGAATASGDPPPTG